MNLPTIQLAVTGDVFTASGVTNEIAWSIRAEAERATAARTSIRINGAQVADVTIHAEAADLLAAEVQEVGAALVWSALRAKSSQTGAQEVIIDLRTSDGHSSASLRDRFIAGEGATPEEALAVLGSYMAELHRRGLPLLPAAEICAALYQEIGADRPTQENA